MHEMGKKKPSFIVDRCRGFFVPSHLNVKILCYEMLSDRWVALGQLSVSSMKDNKVSIFSECSAEEYDGKEKKDCIVTSQEEEGLLMSWQSSQNTFTLAQQ